MENIEKSNTNQHGNCELKDEEIIKAMPTISYGGHSCEKCKYRHIKDGHRCGLEGCFIARNALDLINRLKVKNEKNENIIRLADKTIETRNAEIERLQKAIKVQDIVIEQQDYKLKRAKTEAIKEFWEKLKERRQWDVDIPEYVFTASGDNLVKEMAEKE